MIKSKKICLKLLLCSITVWLVVAPSSIQGQPPRASDQTTPNKPTQETKISPKEAEQLFHDVDEILRFASEDTGLAIQHEVKRRLATRDEVVAYLEKNMAEDKDAQRLKRSELVLKKFGLIPRDFDLQKFLVVLLREQVAGYYDPKTKTVNLLDWLDAEQQRPVMAHELTHALQDENFGLQKWLKVGETDLNDIKDPTPQDIENDEISEARQAVVEGQAMVTLVDYMLAPTGQSLLESPQIANALKETMLTGTGDSLAFKDAPIFLKEELTFPYRYGLDFTADLLRNGGKAKAFAGAFANPPRSSREIMEPKTYLSDEHIAPVRLPNFKEDFKDYERFDIGAIGEFDVAVLVDQYAGIETSHEIYPHWRGGYYYAARPKNNPSAPLALLYFSTWSDEQSAAKFAAIYAKALPKRYQHVDQKAADGAKPILGLKSLDGLQGTHIWSTEDGSVVIDVDGNSVVITEGLDDATTTRVEHELLPSPTGAKQ